ncbi:MAG: monovalent cation/H(+) antiporter subunit G [Thermoleophilaceae bacterium]
MTWRSVAAVVLLCGGGALCMIATLGVVVMRDWQDRAHYVGLSGFGVALIGASILVRESFSVIGDKALLTAVIVVFVGPVVVHTTFRSGRIRTLGDWRRNVDEELEP